MLKLTAEAASKKRVEVEQEKNDSMSIREGVAKESAIAEVTLITILINHI